MRADRVDRAGEVGLKGSGCTGGDWRLGTLGVGDGVGSVSMLGEMVRAGI
jgi:hypothetical protein